MEHLFSNISLFQCIGVAGFIGYISGFAGLQFGLIDGNSRVYCLISIASASLVLIGLMEHFNLASALIQVSWIVIGVSGLVLRSVRRRKEQADINHRRHRLDVNLA